MTSPQDVARIAEGLSNQMRSALTWPKVQAVIPRFLYPATIAALDRRGLISQTYSLTPLGILVRRYLEQEQGRK